MEEVVKRIRKDIRFIAYDYLRHSLKSPREIDGKMAYTHEIDETIEKYLPKLKDELYKYFYRNNYRNVMHVARNWDFEDVETKRKRCKIFAD